MVYSRDMFYKKPKKPAARVLVGLSAGSLLLEDLSGDDGKPAAFWGSRVNSISGSISGLSDVESLENLVAKETSYIDSDENNKMNKTTLQRTCT
ncbi:hypothetical protein G9A89_017814 [Geosiphon pyriformis]|nr:hypothetical protein G9A89_017814 [Geosiphon pyriformis]